MSDDFSDMTLRVTISADTWAETQRRIKFLEAVIVQVFRDKICVKEWFSYADLERMQLRGLPSSRTALSKIALGRNWRRRVITAQGGERYEFHYSSFPPQAFEDLINRIVSVHSGQDNKQPKAELILPEGERPTITAENATAQWVLPLMRVIKSEKTISVSEIITKLETILPAGAERPTEEEINTQLSRWGLLG